MSNSNDDLKEKATTLVTKAAFKETMKLTPAQESLAVKVIHETFQQMVNDGKAVTDLNHITLSLLLKTIKSLRS